MVPPSIGTDESEADQCRQPLHPGVDMGVLTCCICCCLQVLTLEKGGPAVREGEGREGADRVREGRLGREGSAG